MSETAASIDWALMEQWDRAYYLHTVQAASEHVWQGVAFQERNHVVLADGTRLLDFHSQLASDNLGHRHPRVVAEIERALGRYGHVQFAMATDYRARAAKLVVEDLLGPDDWAGRMRLLSSGTDAVESALMMARLVTGRPLVLTQEHSFHGFTASSGTRARGYRNHLAAVDGTWVRDVPGFPPPSFVPIPAPEHSDFAADGTLPSIARTRAILDDVGPDKVAAVITETMSGPGILNHDDYLRQLRELTAEHGILWVCDDIIGGFGRLGEWFSYRLYPGLTPDLLVIGKGMNGCILPVGAVVASRPIAEQLERERWFSGSTWDGHPIVAASVVANIEAMREERVLERAAERSRQLEDGLRRLAVAHPCVGRVEGRGLCWSVGLVDAAGAPIVAADLAFPFAGDLSDVPSFRVVGEARRRGVLLGGSSPNAVKLAPPLTIDEDEVATALDALDHGLSALDDHHRGA